jgi:hypothetical protein
MENRKLIKILIPIFISGFFVSNIPLVFGYGANTHSFLTEEAFEFYNQKFPQNKISGELKQYLIDGSRREDDTPRWMNHFYDPVYNRGMTYDPKIDILNIGSWQSSKEWAKDSASQNKWLYKVPAAMASILNAIERKKISEISTETDFTWQRAIGFYATGEKEKAMFMLGHVLHLLEDASVPDHTRNDAHPGDSPYELFADKFNLQDPDKNLASRLLSRKPVILENLDSYFDELAKYSNNNFYSKETIGIQSGYNLPTPTDYERIKDILFARGEDEGGFYKLSSQPVQSSILVNIKGAISIDDKRILSAYWSRLSTKSVEYSAGAINLFLEEAEKAEEQGLIVNKEKSFIAQAGDAIKSFVSSIGSAAREAFSTILAGKNLEKVAEVSLGDLNKNPADKIPAIPKENKPKITVPTVSIDKVEVRRGETVTRKGTRFTAGGQVVLYLDLPNGEQIKTIVNADREGGGQRPLSNCC